MHSSLSDTNRKQLMCWLGVVIGMVIFMVSLGGFTRLTESGLSMVNWQPIHGTLPPLNEAEWAEEFAHYQNSPEFQKKNTDMDLQGFKGIFWLEYLHRLMGRLIGIAFFVPFAFFLIRGVLSLKQTVTYGGLFLLGGAQGVLGWYMVQSGLVDEPMVSPLRLAAHLSLACLLFCLLLWQWLKLRYASINAALAKPFIGMVMLLFIQIILGAFVAGLDAGLIANDFPTMHGKWVPDGLWLAEPWWQNLYQNPTTAHFVHRMMAYAVSIYIFVALWRYLRTEQLARWCLGLLGLQMTLGIFTVIWQVPTVMAAAHQLTGLLLLGAAVSLLYHCRSATRLAS